MADTKWNDKLRSKLQEHTETPPEGLWEAIESAAGPAREKSAGGFWGWLTGRPALWPVWATVGVAAALAAVLLIHTPSGPSFDPVTKSDVPLVASAGLPQDDAEASGSLPEDTDELQDTSGLMQEGDGTFGLSQEGDGPSHEGADAAGRSREGAGTFGRPQVGAGEGSADHAEDVAAEGSADTSVNAASEGASVNVASEDAAINAEGADDASEGTAVGADGAAADAASEDAAVNAERAVDASKDAASEGAERQKPGEGAPVRPGVRGGQGRQTPDVKRGPARVPVTKATRRDRPLLAWSVMGGSNPAGTSSTTTSEYGLPSYPVSEVAGHGPRLMSALSRNKSTETNISQRMDYQAGLMLNVSFSEHWGLESGVMVTGLSSTSTSSTGSLTRVSAEHINYVGFPINVVYTPWRGRHLSAYLSAGPAAEYGISRHWTTTDTINSTVITSDPGSDRPGDWVFSASLNAGVQWHPWEYGAFFLQPGVVGRLVNDASPDSFYTTHPVSFRLAAGYRLTF